MAEPARKLGWDDYQAFPEDGKRRQIIDGEVFVSPSPNVKHQDVAGELFFLIKTFNRSAACGRVFIAPLGVMLSDHDIVEPDILFFSESGPAVPEKNRILGPPELVVEVLSPSNRRVDLLRKRRLYEKAGVAEYWILDPEAESLARFVLEGGAYRVDPPVFAEPGGVVKSPHLPGFELDVAALFAACG